MPQTRQMHSNSFSRKPNSCETIHRCVLTKIHYYTWIMCTTILSHSPILHSPFSSSSCPYIAAQNHTHTAETKNCLLTIRNALTRSTSRMKIDGCWNFYRSKLKMISSNLIGWERFVVHQYLINERINRFEFLRCIFDSFSIGNPCSNFFPVFGFLTPIFHLSISLSPHFL